MRVLPVDPVSDSSDDDDDDDYDDDDDDGGDDDDGSGIGMRRLWLLVLCIDPVRAQSLIRTRIINARWPVNPTECKPHNIHTK